MWPNHAGYKLQMILRFQRVKMKIICDWFSANFILNHLTVAARRAKSKRDVILKLRAAPFTFLHSHHLLLLRPAPIVKLVVMCSSNPQNLTCVYCKAKISGHENSFLENHLWQPKPRDCCSVGRSLKFSHNVKIKSPRLVSTQKVDQLMPEKESTHSFNKAVNKQLAYAQLENRLIVVSCGFDQQLCLVHHLLLLI